MRSSWAEQAVAPRQQRRTLLVEVEPHEVGNMIRDLLNRDMIVTRRTPRVGRSRASAAAAADETAAGAQLGAVLEKLIAALPEKLRQPFILSTLEEMTPREVAATLGVNEAAVRSRVFRARRILKQKLAPSLRPK